MNFGHEPVALLKLQVSIRFVEVDEVLDEVAYDSYKLYYIIIFKV